MSLLEVDDVKITYRLPDKDVHAVNNVSFSIEEGDNYGLVGESGSGKSTLAKAVLGLLDDNGEIRSGSIRFDGRELIDLSERDWRSVRRAPWTRSTR